MESQKITDNTAKFLAQQQQMLEDFIRQQQQQLQQARQGASQQMSQEIPQQIAAQVNLPTLTKMEAFGDLSLPI